MKQLFKWMLKAVIAGILALAISSAVCFIYYNPAIHVTGDAKATDYVRLSNRFTSFMTEGMAWNHTDKNGYNNAADNDKNMDVLIMGSSHMEGIYVFQKEHMATLLGEMTGRTVYNIGMTGHDLLVCTKNLKAALEEMTPTRYLIIETSTTDLSAADINKCLSGEMESMESHDSGIIFELQKIQYLRLAYAQLKSWNAMNKRQSEDVPTVQGDIPDITETVSAYGDLMEYISEACAAYGVQPVIFYHPYLAVNTDGTVTEVHEESLGIFKSACEENGIIFADMTEDFLNMYESDRTLPHGFLNTAVGSGHLNKYGHKAIAERLSDIISGDGEISEDGEQ